MCQSAEGLGRYYVVNKKSHGATYTDLNLLKKDRPETLAFALGRVKLVVLSGV